MATFDLLNLQPHEVSRDLSSYITFIYGPPKCGKTTLASQMPNSLLIAFEHGYNALPGIKAVDITSWGDMKSLSRELKKPEVKEIYKCLVIDTVDIAATLCEKYVCNQLGIENIGDGGWTTNGWAKYKREFEEMFRSLTMMGYAVFFISHAKEKTISPKDGKEYQQIIPSTQSSALAIIENMVDLYGYAHPIRENDESRLVLTLRDPSGEIACGGRFKYIDPEIDFNYDSLLKALNDAIDKEAKLNDNKFVTDKREVAPVIIEYDYDTLMQEFEVVVGNLMTKNQEYYAPRVTQIIEKYLGKGKKVSNATRDQAEFISLILEEIKAELIK